MTRLDVRTLPLGRHDLSGLQSLLHKTIVFITHDFDEAIRLADRIAIMFEGAIVQIGTAEELITSPATDYVAEFTKHVPRDKLLTVGFYGPPKHLPPGGLLHEGDSITQHLHWYMFYTPRDGRMHESAVYAQHSTVVQQVDNRLTGSWTMRDLIKA